MERRACRQRTDLGRACVADRRVSQLGTWREHCRLSHGSNRTNGGNVSMGRRKAELARRRIDKRESGSGRSLHADGLVQHTICRLWGRSPRRWWSSLQHSGVPILSCWQPHGVCTILEEEPQAPGYVIHKIAVWRPTVSMTISGVPLSPVGQVGRAFPLCQGCCSRAVAEKETTPSPPADQAVTE